MLSLKRHNRFILHCSILLHVFDLFLECLQAVNVTAWWMGLLNDVIGDLRLGDLTLPGSHDAATEGCTADSFLVDQSFLFGIAQEVAPEIVAGWSRTQQDDLDVQLQSGKTPVPGACPSTSKTKRTYGISTGIFEFGKMNSL